MCCSIIISTAILYHFYRFPIHLERRLLEISTVWWVWRTPQSRWRFARPNICTGYRDHAGFQSANATSPQIGFSFTRPTKRKYGSQELARTATCSAADASATRGCSSWKATRTGPSDPPRRQAPRRPTRNGIARSKLTPYQWPSSVDLIASHTTSAASAAASSAVLPRRIAPENTDA